MSSFLTALWESIFTPGPTPALLVATNASFGCLQLLLFALLSFTHSIHFLILSVICGGLWASINWFAREVAAAKANDPNNNTTTEKRQTSPDPTGSDTETETEARVTTTAADTASGGGGGGGVVERRRPPPGPAKEGASAMPPPTAPASGGRQQQAKVTSPPRLEPTSMTAASSGGSGMGDSQELGRRRRSLGDSSGYVSTDSEWEKVSEGDGK